MKRNGFTLVELLAVIVLLGLLLALAVPNALKLRKNVTSKSYDTKIDLIEQAANSYGLSNLSLVRRGTEINDSTKHRTCTFSFNKKEVSGVSYSSSREYSENAELINEANKKEYWCIRLSIADLVATNELDWDLKNQCEGKSSCNKVDYDNIVINPVTKNIINRCYVYIYYRNNRAYSYFDINNCNSLSNTPTDGNEYPQYMN